MLNTSRTSILSPALLGGLLCLVACNSKEDATAGNSTDDVATEGTTESAPTTGTVPTTTAMETTTDPSDGTDTTTGGACDDHDVVDACCCFELDPGGEFNPPAVEIGCGDSPLCPKVAISCENPDEPQGGWGPCASTADEAALDCALQALAAGEPGSLQIEYYGGISSDTLHYYVRGEGTAFHYVEEHNDSFYQVGGVEHRALKPASFFTDCLSADSVEAKGACLRDAMTGDVLEQCTEAAEY